MMTMSIIVGRVVITDIQSFLIKTTASGGFLLLKLPTGHCGHSGRGHSKPLLGPFSIAIMAGMNFG